VTTRDDVLNVVIPHRLEAIATLNLLSKLRMSWGQPKPVEVYFGGKLQITGNSNAFANPVIEAGLIHCRALLEFIGLAVSPRRFVQDRATRLEKARR